MTLGEFKKKTENIPEDLQIWFDSDIANGFKYGSAESISVQTIKLDDGEKKHPVEVLMLSED